MTELHYEPPQQPDRGTMILVFGILGFLCCVIFGIFAWVFANQDLEAMARGEMNPAGRSLTEAGRIIAIVAVCKDALGLLAAIVWFIFVFSLGMGGALLHSH